MAAATNEQVQSYVGGRVRPRCEQIRALVLACVDDKAAFDDIYANLTAPGVDWTDQRPTDHPPHLLTPADVLAWNTFITGFKRFVEGIREGHEAEDAAEMAAAAAQYPVILKSCVRAVGSAS